MLAHELRNFLAPIRAADDLLNNAVKYTPPGGIITLRVQAQRNQVVPPRRKEPPTTPRRAPDKAVIFRSACRAYSAAQRGRAASWHGWRQALTTLS